MALGFCFLDVVGSTYQIHRLVQLGLCGDRSNSFSLVIAGVKYLNLPENLSLVLRSYFAKFGKCGKFCPSGYAFQHAMLRQD